MGAFYANIYKERNDIFAKLQMFMYANKLDQHITNPHIATSVEARSANLRIFWSCRFVIFNLFADHQPLTASDANETC